MLAKVYGIIPYAAEISSPPCAVIGLILGIAIMAVVSGWRIPVKALFGLGINLDTLYHDEQVRVLIQAGFSALLSGIAPVIRILGTVPFCKNAIVLLAVRLVLQVDSDDSVIVLVVIREPCQSVQPVLLAEVCVLPHVPFAYTFYVLLGEICLF